MTIRRVLTSLALATALGLTTACTGGTPTPSPTESVLVPPRESIDASRQHYRKPFVPKPTAAPAPKPKPVAKPAPKPAPKPAAKPAPRHVAPGGIAACIRKYESGDDYTAQNPSSTASGAYQFLDSTWQGVTGLPGRAMNYPPATQDAAFWKLWNNGRGASQWVTAFHCV